VAAAEVRKNRSCDGWKCRGISQPVRLRSSVISARGIRGCHAGSQRRASDNTPALRMQRGVAALLKEAAVAPEPSSLLLAALPVRVTSIMRVHWGAVPKAMRARRIINSR
jgi:hypothetical protein